MRVLPDCLSYCFRGKTCGTILTQFVKALIVRLLFTVHGVVTIWKVTDVCDKKELYLLCVPVALLWVEMILTTVLTKNGEWKWFCPSVLLYLASVIPGVWLLQTELYQTREDYRENNELEMCQEMMMFKLSRLPEFGAISIPLLLEANQWASGLQQIMFVVLIIGRWLLPKGHLTRDQLSQLLLVYLGIAADSLEFSLETLDMPEVFCNPVLIAVVLAIWTWSMLQFILVRSSVSGRKIRGIVQAGDVETESSVRGCCHGCGNEIWSLLITVFLQDGPFLIMRLYLMIKFKVLNEMMLFFVVKNFLVVCIQLYRVAVLCLHPPRDHSLSDRHHHNANVDSRRVSLVVEEKRHGNFNNNTCQNVTEGSLSMEEDTYL